MVFFLVGSNVTDSWLGAADTAAHSSSEGSERVGARRLQKVDDFCH